MKRKRLILIPVLTTMAVLGLIAGVAAEASHEGGNFWLHCSSIPLVCQEEAVPTVTETETETETETQTETVTQTETETETITVTETSPTPPPPTPPPPTPPPPTPPPPTPGPVACSVLNWESWGPIYNAGDCIVGTTITVTNALWFCNQPLANYGPLPIRIVQVWTNAVLAQNGIELRTGCRGDGTPLIDLITEQTILGTGRISDPLKTRMSPGPQDVDVTGFLNATGPLAVRDPQDHQDCIQLQGGWFTDFVNIKGCFDGSFSEGRSNTQAAGGVVFFSLNNSQVTISGGEFLGCNHGIEAHPNETGTGMSASRVVGAKFRSGRNAGNGGEPGLCLNGSGEPLNASPPCTGRLDTLAQFDAICQRWVNGQWVNTPPA